MEKEKKEKTNELEKKVSTLTMCMVVMGVLVLSLGGYLLYDKVGNKSNAEGTVVISKDNNYGNCGRGMDSDGNLVRIIANNVPVYDSKDRSKQIDTLNLGDDLYFCESQPYDGIACKIYRKADTNEVIDNGRVWIKYDSCKNYTYLN